MIVSLILVGCVRVAPLRTGDEGMHLIFNIGLWPITTHHVAWRRNECDREEGMLELLLYQLFVSEASEVEPTERATWLTDTIDGPNRDWSRSHRHSVQYRIEDSV